MQDRFNHLIITLSFFIIFSNNSTNCKFKFIFKKLIILFLMHQFFSKKKVKVNIRMDSLEFFVLIYLIHFLNTLIIIKK